jgi:cardiolipin synthase
MEILVVSDSGQDRQRKLGDDCGKAIIIKAGQIKFRPSSTKNKDSIILINPYFLPTPIVRKALEKAIDDGVKVTIILSEKSDIPSIPQGVWRVGYQLMKRGAEVYMYTGGFNHSKVMCIDGKFCTIGSANLNSRSLMYDYETNLFIFGKEDTDELQHYIELDKQQSYRLTKEIYKKRSWWKRFNGWLISLVIPIT